MNSRYITWSMIYGIMIGAVAGVVMDSTAAGIGLGVAIAVIVALVWSGMDRARGTDRR